MNTSEIILTIYSIGAAVIFIGLVLSIKPDKNLWEERLIYWSLISVSWPILLGLAIILFLMFLFFDLRWFLIYGVIWEKISTEKSKRKLHIKGSTMWGLDFWDDSKSYRA